MPFDKTVERILTLSATQFRNVSDRDIFDATVEVVKSDRRQAVDAPTFFRVRRNWRFYGRYHSWEDGRGN